MRILVISNLFPPVVEGGYELECAGVVEHLRETHEVRVLTSTRRRREAPAGELGVERVLPVLAVSPGGSLRAPRASVVAARRTEEAIAGFRPDLIQFWNGFGLPLSTLVTAGRSGVPLSLRICEHWFGHVFESDQFARELRPASRGPMRSIWAAGMRAVDRLPRLRLTTARPFAATISWNSDFLRERTAVPAEVEAILEERIYPALPEGDRFATLERRPSPEPTIAFVGRVSEQKGIGVAIEALALLRGQHGVSSARLLVAGRADRSTERDVGRRLSELGVEGAGELLGELDGEELAGLYSRAHAVIVPSVWEEPAGMVCVEAALARVPLVASRSGGIPELVRDGEEALLFDRGDAAGAAAHLAEALGDPVGAEARVARAFERGRELSFGPYAEATDRFLDRTMAAFAERSSASSSPAA